eukprot:scaffold66010_cov54-Attheya_sp.AAC.4
MADDPSLGPLGDHRSLRGAFGSWGRSPSRTGSNITNAAGTKSDDIWGTSSWGDAPPATATVGSSTVSSEFTSAATTTSDLTMEVDWNRNHDFDRHAVHDIPEVADLLAGMKDCPAKPPPPPPGFQARTLDPVFTPVEPVPLPPMPAPASVVLPPVHHGNPFQEMPVLPHKTLGVPKNALNAWYGKRFKKTVLNNTCFQTWNDGGLQHIRKFTSLFTCPVTGEVFASGQYDRPEDDFVVVPTQINSFQPPAKVIWYAKKMYAEHAAAARAYDCFSLRENAGNMAKSVRMCVEQPYMSASEAPPHPIAPMDSDPSPAPVTSPAVSVPPFQPVPPTAAIPSPALQTTHVPMETTAAASDNSSLGFYSAAGTPMNHDGVPVDQKMTSVSQSVEKPVSADPDTCEPMFEDADEDDDETAQYWESYKAERMGNPPATTETAPAPAPAPAVTTPTPEMARSTSDNTYRLFPAMGGPTQPFFGSNNNNDPKNGSI